MECNKNLKFSANICSWCWVPLISWFLFCHSELNIGHCFLAFFCDKFIVSNFLYLRKVLIVLIPRVKAWHIHFACITSLNKLRDGNTSQIDILTNKLDNWNKISILWVFSTHFHFKTVLSSNTQSWLVNIYCS